MSDASGSESPAQAASRPASPPLIDQNDNHLLALQAEQIKLLYASSPAALVATVVCVMALVAVEWTVVPLGPLLAWLAYMLTLTTSRFMLVRAFQQAAPGQQDTSRWQARFLIGAVLAGLGWGSAAFLLFPESSAPHQVFLIFMLGGMTAGAVSTLPAKLSAFLCFALPTMTPAVIQLLSQETPLASTMALMVVIFTLVLTYVTARMHATIVRSLELRLQNSALLDQLRLHTVQREQAELARAASDRQLETLIQASPLAIMSLDTEGNHIVRWNRAAEQIFGWREEEILGRPFPLVPPGLEDESDALWNQAVRAGFLRGIELQRLRKDGTLIDIALWVTVLKDADGRVTDTFGIVEDITDRTRVEEALHLSERALRRALREREQLARNLHDNIIQSIYAIGFTLEECQRLAQEVPADANRKLDQVIAALNRVIREVRGYIVAPVEESETLSSDELMASLQRLGGLMENANSMRFSLTLDPAAASTLTDDQRAQLLYVAQEAMSNSLRHSGATTARVSLACTTGGVRFEILDNGVGFALQRMRNGNGGLKNIRLRARKIGANLDITSHPMEGTVISMEIPTNGHHDNARKI